MMPNRLPWFLVKYVNEEVGSLMIWMFRYYNDNQRPKYNIYYSPDLILLLKLTGVGIITDCVRIELAELSDWIEELELFENVRTRSVSVFEGCLFRPKINLSTVSRTILYLVMHVECLYLWSLSWDYSK